VFALAATAVLHARPLAAPFFADDWLFLDLVRSRSLLGAVLAPDPIGNFFRPLGRAVWFWLLARSSHESPLAFHVAGFVLWLVAIALLWAIALRLAGSRAAAITAAIFSLTYAADVPLRWASGSQDLIATVLALAATALLLAGRRWAAAALFLLAPLAKEVVALAVLPAALLARRAGEPWRITLGRAGPSLAATLAWAVITALAHSGRHGPSALSFSPLAPIAALWDAVRTFFGIEWPTGRAASAPLLAPVTLVSLLLGAAAVLVSAPDAEGSASEDGATSIAPQDVRLGAAVWVLVGALPVALVAPIWSAYFDLFAMAGAALLAGSLLSTSGRLDAALVLVVLGLAARRAGDVREFTTRPQEFSAQSHVNDFYLGRGMSVIVRGIADLRRLHANPPHGSTFFFTGVPSFAALQAGDGALVRGVYRDSSLRSYYLTDLTRARAFRGPSWFVFYSPDSGYFQDETDDPELFARIAMSQLLNGREDAAREALEVGRSRGRMSATAYYLAGFMALDHRDSTTAASCLREAGCTRFGPADDVIATAVIHESQGDTTGAERVLHNGLLVAALDERLHDHLADLQLSRPGERRLAAMEAYAARVLAPRDGLAWRRWSLALYWQLRFAQARDALERYFALDPEGAAKDHDAVALRAALPRMLPGGDVYQHELLKEADR
jgi:hypothetical protein